MKPKNGVKDVVISILLLGLVSIGIVIFSLYCLGRSIVSYAATLTLNGQKHRLLSQLRRVGKPYWCDGWEDYDEMYFPCSKHGPKCTLDNCLVKRAEKYEELVRASRMLGIEQWRVRLAAQ